MHTEKVFAAQKVKALQCQLEKGPVKQNSIHTITYKWMAENSL